MKRLINIIILMGALCLLCFPAAAHENGVVEDAKGYIVRLNSPLPKLFDVKDGGATIRAVYEPMGLYAVDDLEHVMELQSQGLLDAVEPDYVVELFDQQLFSETNSEDETENSVPSIENELDHWQKNMIQPNRSRELGCMGQSVRVAVIDSGVTAHDELRGHLLEGYNFLDENTDVTDNIGHGTFVAGLIAANDDGVGITGIAPRACVVPLKCFDTNKTTTVSVICRAIYAAIDTYGCQAINMSFGVKTYTENLEKAIDYATSSGAVCVASAGNLGTTTLYYPAACKNAIGVGAVDDESVVASFSQRNESVFVTAPGKGVCSTTNDGGYGTKNGTSFSAPLVTGSVACMLNAAEDVAPQSIRKALIAGAVDLGEEGYDTDYGYGLVSLTASLNALINGEKVFLSPVLAEEEIWQVRVLNNDTQELTAQLFFVEYDKGLMIDFSWVDIKLKPGEVTTVYHKNNNKMLRYYVWKSIGDIAVLAPKREIEGIL